MSSEDRMSTGDPQSALRLRAATEADFPAVIGLLEGANLPTEGVSADSDGFLVAEYQGRILAAVGLEVYGESALLRSAVVEPAERGAGVGGLLVNGIIDHARRRGITDVYLLTTTAEQYFTRFGFAAVDRPTVPDTVRASVEFGGACPDSATVMRKVL